MSTTHRTGHRDQHSSAHTGHGASSTGWESPRKKKKRRKKRTILLSAAAAAVIAAAGGVWLIQSYKSQDSLHVVSNNNIDMGTGYRDIEYNGKHYRYNSLIKTVLVAGLHSEGKMEPTENYTMAAVADSINLVIMDKKHKSMTIMALSRDTMTEVGKYTLYGDAFGTATTHLGFAYTYGEGGTVSCKNLKEAVSNLLGVPINEYLVTNLSSLEAINNLVDSVPVTVPNDDLAAEDPAFTKGSQVTITADNVEFFVRSRDSSQNFSNDGRMERQKAYITSYVDRIQDKLSNDLENTWNKLDSLNDYMQTSITKNKYLDMAEFVIQTDFTDADFYIPAGEDFAGELHDEFYIDEAALKEKVIELFYEEI